MPYPNGQSFGACHPIQIHRFPQKERRPRFHRHPSCFATAWGGATTTAYLTVPHLRLRTRMSHIPETRTNHGIESATSRRNIRPRSPHRRATHPRPALQLIWHHASFISAGSRDTRNSTGAPTPFNILAHCAHLPTPLATATPIQTSSSNQGALSTTSPLGAILITFQHNLLTSFVEEVEKSRCPFSDASSRAPRSNRDPLPLRCGCPLSASTIESLCAPSQVEPPTWPTRSTPQSRPICSAASPATTQSSSSAPPQKPPPTSQLT